jgi:phosphoserine phosphatase RsbU/P
VLWLLALIAGMVLTRTVTRMVDKLDEATRHVKARDFSHRISVVHRDQLGALAESFNSMTASIEDLLEEQRQHERLENEVAIAREVQSQLFPQSLPEVPGLELGAVCRAARMVSGDYYDCLQLDSRRVAMVVADVSGKGISAALVMASLNAALRGLVLSDGNVDLDTAKLSARLNRHLLHNTSDDRYATLFFAIYDASNRTLRYTNAGHLPPFFITGNRIERLDRGGTVVGLLDHCTYEQATISVEPGTLLVAYSDGMTEPENPYGEEFGSDRLMDEVMRHRNDPPGEMCNELVEAVKNWCAPAEPFDDQTILVARMS